MGFNRALITEEIDLGQVYENPIQVFSRNQKSKEDLKICRKSKWEKNNKHHYAIYKGLPPLGTAGVFPHSEVGNIEWTDLGQVWDEQSSFLLKNWRITLQYPFVLRIAELWKSLLQDAAAARSWKRSKEDQVNSWKKTPAGPVTRETRPGGSGGPWATRRRLGHTTHAL